MTSLMDLVVENNIYIFSCIWLLKTRFRFYMDVVDNNDFLFMYLVVENNIHFHMDVVDNNDSLDFLDVFIGC